MAFQIFKKMGKVDSENSDSPQDQSLVDIISELRNKEKNKEDVNKKLISFSPSREFKGGRPKSDLKQYSGLIALKIPELGQDLIGVTKNEIKQISFVRAVVIGSDDNSLEIFVKTENEDVENHDKTIGAVSDYFEKMLRVKVDRSENGFDRLCKLSYDTELFYNLESEVFPDIVKVSDPYLKCVDSAGKLGKYKGNDRNDFLYRLASNANRYGIEEKELIRLVSRDFLEDDFGEKQISKNIKSAYLVNKEEFASFASFATVANLSNKSPFFPESVHGQLPQLLKDSVDLISYKGKRERDVFLISALGILSGVFPNVEGIYFGSPLAPPLNVFIIAPPASGKGVMVFAKMLGDNIHEKLFGETKERLKAYKIAKRKFQKQADGDGIPEPEKPKIKVLFIPGNVSSAAVINHLSQNEGFGIIAESEADTMTNSLKQDWGGFSDLIRKVFHHETVSSSRKGKDEFMLDENFLEIKRPKLAIVITGTPSQVSGLINSAEDGLFSRFCYYSYGKDPEWNDVFGKSNKVNLDNDYAKISKEVLEISNKFMDNHLFSFSSNQEKKFNDLMSKMLEEADDENINGLVSAVTRLGPIAFRIAMILSILRHYSDKKVSKVIKCSDKDYDSAIAIVTVLYQHSKSVALTFSDSSKFEKLGHRSKYYNALPNVEFTRGRAIQMAKKMEVSERTADRFLSNLVDMNLLKKVKNGVYKKK